MDIDLSVFLYIWKFCFLRKKPSSKDDGDKLISYLFRFDDNFNSVIFATC